MKPFNVEIFDRDFRFRATALILESDFSYKYDYFSPGKNTITLPERIKYRQDSLSTTAGDDTVGEGDYIRITTSYTEITGVIVKLDTEEKKVKATFTDGLALFDHEVSIPPTEILDYNIQDYIKELLKQEFVDAADTLQRINLSFSVDTGTYKGIFDFTQSDDPFVVINLLNDLIIPAFRYYLIRTYVSIDVSAKVVNVTISKVVNAAKTIESRLPNVLTKKITVKQGTESANKLTVFDLADPTLRYDYYLHSNDYSYSTIDAYRIIPVKNQIEFIDTNKITEEAFWHDNAEAEATVAALLQKNNTLSSTELIQLRTSINRLWNYVKTYIEAEYGLTSSWYKNKVELNGFSTSSDPWYPVFDFARYNSYGVSNGANYKNVTNYYDDEELYGGNNYTFRINSYASSILSSYFDYRRRYQGTLPQNAPAGTSGTYTTSDGYPDEVQSVITGGATQMMWWRKDGKTVGYTGPGSTPGSYVTTSWKQQTNSSYSHLHFRLPYTVDFKGNQYYSESAFPDEGDLPYGRRNVILEDILSGYINVPLTVSSFNSAMEAYKASPAYETAYETYRAQMIDKLISDYVSKTFIAAKYANNIELSFGVNDSMVNPLNMPIGQEVNIICDDVSYNSLLTGYEIKDKVIKLVFGTVRLDLTKQLNMKGV